MQKTKLVSDLLAQREPAGGAAGRLADLRARLEARATLLHQVRDALPERLARHIASAEFEHGRLTVGVTAAIWASRLRYACEGLRKALGSMDMAVVSVRIRVLPCPPDPGLTREPPPARMK
jgi:hypothetical protein